MTKPWTPANDKKLKTLLSEGFTHEGAARIMKRTPDDITERVKLVIQGKHWLKSEDDMLRQLTLQGDTEAKIARAIGRTKSAVKSRRLALNITAPKQDQGMVTKVYRGDDEKFLKLLHKHHPNQFNVAKRSDDGYVR